MEVPLKALGHLFAATAVSALASIGSALPFTADFETNQSANFTVTIANATPDCSTSFTYNSLSHVQANGAPIVINKAPSSPTSTSAVLRLNANLGAEVVQDSDAVSVYPNTGTLPSAWAMTWDCWQNYNGGALGAGGTGTTNMLIFGATNNTAVAPKSPTTASIAGDGFWFTMSGEDGAAQDYRFYSGTGTIARNDAGVSWFGAAPGTNLSGGGSTDWTGFFPQPTYETAGAMGKAWITIRLVVSGTNATVSVKRVGDSGFTTIGTAAVPGTATKPFVGFSDINASAASPVSDQFVLVDNMVVDVAPTAAQDWSLYQ